MGIFCTVRAFMRFRGPQALKDTYEKPRGRGLGGWGGVWGGVPLMVNQEIHGSLAD